jgi:hypothetical protein
MFKKSNLFKTVFLILQFFLLSHAQIADENANSTTSSLMLNSSFNSNNTNTSVVAEQAPVNNAMQSMNIVPSLTSTSNAAATTASNTSNLVVILVSLIVVACIIVIIIGALFVMRRRFDLWRGMGGNKSLNNEKTIDDGETGELKTDEQQQQSGENVVSNVNEQENGMPDNLTSIDNKQAVVQVEANSENAQVNVEKPGEENMVQKQAPVSVTEQQTENVDQISKQKSSTSVIANVLNELSESVVAKLSTSKSPVKSEDPEKQPLNTE